MTGYLLASMQSWGLILGVLSPILISVVQQPSWSGQVRTLVGVVVSLAIGVLTVLANGGADLKDWLATLALVLVASQATYRGIFKPSGAADAIEKVTSLRVFGKHSKERPNDYQAV